MSITTFDSLIAAANTEKTFLCEIDPIISPTDWTLYSGQTYTTTLFAGVDIISVTALNRDIAYNADKEALGSFEYSLDGKTIYIKLGVGLSPLSYIVSVAVRVRYANSLDVIFDDKFYEPFLATSPVINQAKANSFWGVSITSEGQVSLYNNKGHFDNIYYSWFWQNRPIRILLGGESLPYTEYQEVFKGIILDTKLSTNLFDLSFVDIKYKFDSDIPSNIYSVATYPTLATEDIGKPIPHVWGTVKKMPVVCIDRTNASNAHIFKVAYTGLHGVQSIDAAYVKGVSAPIASTNIAKGLLNILTATYTPGDLVTVDCGGYQSGTTLIENPVEILKQVLILFDQFYGSLRYDLNSFAAAKIKAEDYPCGLAITDFRSGIDIISEIMKSCLGTFYINNSGLFGVTIWDTELPSSLDTVSDIEIVNNSFKAVTKYDEIRKTMRVGYSKNWQADEYAYSEISNNSTEFLYGITRSRTVQTLLSSSAGAEKFRDRLGLLSETATVELTFKEKVQLAKKNIGDRISLSFKRTPDESNFNWLDDKPVDIVKIKKDFAKNIFTVTVDDLKGIGSSIGHWADSPVTFPTSLGGGSGDTWDSTWTIEQKAYAKSHWGYWTDANGFIDPDDGDSRNVSRWW